MKYINATYKGVISAILLIVVSLVLFYGFHLPENGKSQYVILGLFIAIVIWTIVSYKTNGFSSNTFKDYFSEAFKTFIVVTLFMAIFTYFFYKMNPQILNNAIIENNSLILKEGNRTIAEIEENSNKLRSIFMPMMISITVIKFLFLGSLVSMVGAGFLIQKK